MIGWEKIWWFSLKKNLKYKGEEMEKRKIFTVLWEKKSFLKKVGGAKKKDVGDLNFYFYSL